MSKHKDTILKLRQEGKTYDEIKEATGASKGTIAYHCGNGQKEKTRTRTRSYRTNAMVRKVEAFLKKSKHNRIDGFQRGRKNARKVRTVTFTWKDVVDKFGLQTKCYLTGRSIDLKEARTYQFDHIIPASKDGPNTLDNLGITCTQANQAKRDMMLDEFIHLCKDVLIHQGYSIENGSPESARTTIDSG